MSPAFIALVSLVFLILGIVYVRLPIGFLLAFIGIGGYAVTDGMRFGMQDGLSMALNMAGNELWGTFSSYGLTVIPLFVFMGQLCFHSGLSSRLYQSVQTWCGHRRGGLSLATLLACGGFAAICGSNTATAATMSVVALPEMRKYNYHPMLATGAVVAGTTLGAIIPPSVVAIVVGVQTAQSIEALFMGGLIPGLILLGLFMLTVPVVLRRHPEWAPVTEKSSWKERFKNISGILEGALLFGLVVVCMSLGLFTPTEAGAVGSTIALGIGLVRRTLTWKGFVLAIKESLSIAAMLMFLLAGASMFGKFLTLTRLPFELAEMLANLPIAEPFILLLVLLVFVVGGMVMDALALLVIALPMFFPLAETMGWNTLWFSVTLIVVTSLGAMTPPVGVAAYVVASLSGGRKGEQKEDGQGQTEAVPLGTVFRGAMLFAPAYVLCLVLILLVPAVVTFLPLGLK